MIYALTRDGCHQQKEGIDDSLVDVARMLVEPPPRTGLGQLAELLLERREAGLVVGHGVLGGAGVGLGLLLGRGQPLCLGRRRLAASSSRRRQGFDNRFRRVFRVDKSDPSVLSGIQAHS